VPGKQKRELSAAEVKACAEIPMSSDETAGESDLFAESEQSLSQASEGDIKRAEEEVEKERKKLLNELGRTHGDVTR